MWCFLFHIIFNVDFAATDENICLTYENDDVRLCSIHRSTQNSRIGIRACYHRQDRFLYIRLYGIEQDYETLTELFQSME
jgi:hypothetical protein